MSQEELFGKITDILGSGGYLKAFYDAEDAFDHVREHYPKDVGRMQVYELLEEDGLELKPIPWV